MVRVCQWSAVVGLAVSAALANWTSRLMPQGPERRSTWILQALQNSTRGLRGAGKASAATAEVEAIVATMHPGAEPQHLLDMYRRVDLRGSDVRLDTGAVLEGTRQITPYPAGGWYWKCLQSYSWPVKQHINVVEFVAFFNYVRDRTRSTNFFNKRVLHVFDSRVCSCVVAKGRSSSFLLNRCLRRYMAYAVASDIYIVPLWTISAWNYCDESSRGHPAAPDD